MNDTRERIAVLMSDPLVCRLFDGRARQAIGRPPVQAGGGPPANGVLGPLTEIAVTGWDSPVLTEKVLAAAPALRLIAHTGGSIRHIVPSSVYDRGIRVTTVAAVLAEGVAEFTVMMMLAGLRRAFQFERKMRAGVGWDELLQEAPGALLSAQTVGLIGASRVGRAVIPLLKPFGCRVIVSDPFLSEEDAHAVGVQRAELDVLLRTSDVVSLHAPTLPSTRRMLGAQQLGLLRDGALLVNTARAALIEPDALARELRAGRITAALDVFDDEPLPADSPWRSFEHVVTTPHIAALTDGTLKKQGDETVAEITRFFDGVPLHGEISREAFDRIA